MMIVGATNPNSAGAASDLVAPDNSKPSMPRHRSAGGWRWLRGVGRYYPVFLIFLIWEVLSHLKLLDPMFMPPVEEVARTFYTEVFVSHELLTHMAFSFARAGTGLGLAAVVGVVI